jgi:hypothetical protein
MKNQDLKRFAENKKIELKSKNYWLDDFSIKYNKDLPYTDDIRLDIRFTVKKIQNSNHDEKSCWMLFTAKPMLTDEIVEYMLNKSCDNLVADTYKSMVNVDKVYFQTLELQEELPINEGKKEKRIKL